MEGGSGWWRVEASGGWSSDCPGSPRPLPEQAPHVSADVPRQDAGTSRGGVDPVFQVLYLQILMGNKSYIFLTNQFVLCECIE